MADDALAQSDDVLAQEDVARAALDFVDTLPQAPKAGRFLPHGEAEAIVDATLAHVRAGGDQTETAYLAGHRRRLIETLAVVPMAPRPDAVLLDVGCYGYMGFWAVRHLGYRRVVGTEMPRADGAPTTMRAVVVGDDRIEIEVRHFDLTDTDWPLSGPFDTVACLEVLEHVHRDPSGVLDRLRDLMPMDGTLVISVPNGVSYKTFGEMLAGMPPWTYWFYTPDLSHEPRHALEYTPYTKTLMLHAAGFEQRSFKTIAAFAEPDEVEPLAAMAGAVGIDTRHFGETMISTASKVAEAAAVRRPDAIYDGTGYYRTTWRLVEPRRRAAIAAFARDVPEPDASTDERDREHARQLETAKDDIRRMRRLLSQYEKAIIAMDGDDRRDRRRLMLYRLLSPGKVSRVAEAAEMPARGHWRRVLKRHPLELSLWRGLRRLHRRMKNPENQAAWRGGQR